MALWSPLDLTRPTQVSACLRSLVRLSMTSGQPSVVVCAADAAAGNTNAIAVEKFTILLMDPPAIRYRDQKV